MGEKMGAWKTLICKKMGALKKIENKRLMGALQMKWKSSFISKILKNRKKCMYFLKSPFKQKLGVKKI